MLRQGTLFSSRVVKGVSGLLSSSGWELSLFIEVQQGIQTSVRIVRGYLGFHVSRCRGIKPYLELRQNLVSFRPAAGTKGLLSSRIRGIGSHLEMRWGTQGPL